MAAIRVLAFDGLIPKLSSTLLGDGFAQIASNVKLYSKELRFWKGPRLLDAAMQPPPAVGSYKTLYRLFRSSGESIFLLWETEVDVVPSPVADTIESRIYYTGDGAPKKTNWAMATSGAQPYPTDFMDMGVVGPAVAPGATVTTVGTGTLETRAYVYTNVSTFGAVKAESAPSPPGPLPDLHLDVPSVGSEVTVTLPVYAPVGDQNVTHRRIYRTVIGATTESFQFVAEIPVADVSYLDKKTVAQLGEVLQTGGWIPPPADLQGLVALPGGSLVGFVGNTVYFSVPYYPHAWPLAYAITLPVLRIIGLGVIGSSVVVMTDISPIFIHGGFPGEMYTERVPLYEPCLAKGTIASDNDGVIYASPNGLVLLSSDTRAVVTRDLFTVDEWQPLNPATMKAVVLEGRYIGLFPNEIPSRALVLSRTEPPALSFLELPASAMHVDARNGFLFYVHDTDSHIYQLDDDPLTPLRYRWMSKRWFNDRAVTFSLLRLDADYAQVLDQAAYEAARAAALLANQLIWDNNPDLMGAINGAEINRFDINGSLLQNLPHASGARSVQVNIYGDGELLRASLYPTSLDPIRVTAFKCRELAFEILGNVDVRSLHLATTMEELHAS
jgi:hypothetical protein